MTPNIISIGKRRLCRCAVKCRRAVEYRDISGEVEFTLCEKAAKELAFQTVDALLTAPVVPELRKTASWKNDEKKLKELLAQGLSQGQIALTLGRTISTVRKKLAHMRKTGKL